MQHGVCSIAASKKKTTAEATQTLLLVCDGKLTLISNKFNERKMMTNGAVHNTTQISVRTITAKVTPQKTHLHGDLEHVPCDYAQCHTCLIPETAGFVDIGPQKLGF